MRYKQLGSCELSRLMSDCGTTAVEFAVMLALLVITTLHPTEQNSSDKVGPVDLVTRYDHVIAAASEAADEYQETHAEIPRTLAELEASTTNGAFERGDPQVGDSRQFDYGFYIQYAPEFEGQDDQQVVGYEFRFIQENNAPPPVGASVSPATSNRKMEAIYSVLPGKSPRTLYYPKGIYDGQGFTRSQYISTCLNVDTSMTKAKERELCGSAYSAKAKLQSRARLMLKDALLKSAPGDVWLNGKTKSGFDDTRLRQFTTAFINALDASSDGKTDSTIVFRTGRNRAVRYLSDEKVITAVNAALTSIGVTPEPIPLPLKAYLRRRLANYLPVFDALKGAQFKSKLPNGFSENSDVVNKAVEEVNFLTGFK